jgi:hypothetical protein
VIHESINLNEVVAVFQTLFYVTLVNNSGLRGCRFTLILSGMKINLTETKPREIRPKYFDVRKADILGAHPVWPTPKADPFPQAEMNDIVRKIKLGDEEWMFANVTGDDADKLGMAKAFNYDGKQFFIERETTKFAGDIRISIEASACLKPFLTPIEAIEQLRRMLCESQ